jgi:hypothetical protein
MRTRTITFCQTILGLAIVLGTGATAEADEISYDRDVRPILSAKCFKCHGFDPDTRKAGLRLDTFEGATHGPHDYAALLPGKPDTSDLISRVTTTDEDDRMPPKGAALSAKEVQVLKDWIAQGAKYAGHWSYQPIANPKPPAVKQKNWPYNPIDNFILAKLEHAGRTPAPVADPAVLLRRVYLDLTGLPPSVQVVEAFEAKPTQANYERIVRQLLDNKAFGEHWARWWLDLARYAESTGYSGDFLHIMWPYRDWVVKSLNEGKPFDQFTIEQVAGDLLPKPTRDQQVATAFYRAGAVTLDGGNKPDEIQWMMARDRVNTTGTVWLAATVECAQCHTHKFDAITTKEYYQLAAYFRSNDEEIISLGLRDAVKRLYGSTMMLDSYPSNKMSEDEMRNKATDLSGRIREAKLISDQIVQGRRKPVPGEPDYVQLAKDLNEKESDPIINHYDRYASYRLWVMKDRPLPRSCTILKRGDYEAPGEVVTPGTPAALHPLKRNKISNRLELAQWLVSRDNPLTARVVANRLWNEVFGRGIVTTTEDFGRQGAAPSHPELLDWMATSFMDGGWKMKKLLFTIVTSSTYRQSSDRTDPLVPEELFAFGPRHRLTAEGVRDNALAISGLLDRKMGGPSVFPPQPEGMWREIFQSSVPEYPTSSGDSIYRRSIYVYLRRGAFFPLFSTFDAPTRDVSTTKRLRSNTPLQALALMNETTFVEAAKAFATQIRNHQGSDREKLVWAFRSCVARKPADGELAVLEKLMDEPGGFMAEDNSWFNVAHTLLNLDETVVKR